jgi:chromosome segregation ATPase
MEECDSLTRDLEGELEDWKERAVFAEEKEKCLRKQFSSTVENLQMEVDARQKIAAWIAEDRRIVQLELEKQLKDLQVESLQVKDTAITQGGDMAKEFEAAMVEMQAELDASKRQVADSAMDGELLRTAFDDAMKTVQKESAVWEEKLASANEQLRSVKTQLTDCMQALQSEVVMCRERIESIIQEGSSEKQELQDRINELQMDLREWKERAESLEHQLKDSHTKSQTESQEWRERSVAIAQETVSLQTELQSTMDIVIELRTQLDTYKENKFSQEKLNEELQRNLLLVSEEAEVRKEKLLQVLSDLENTQTHQNELQRKLHLAHQHMVEDERCTYNMSTMEKEVAVMAVNCGSEVFSEPLYIAKCGSTTSDSSSQ